MESTIRALIVIIVMTSGAYSIALFSLDFILHLYNAKQAKNRQLAEEVEQYRQLTMLNETERSILKYALINGGNVWLPADNINVISLCSQGMLEALTYVSVHRGDFYSGRQCFAYRVSGKIKDYVKEKGLLATPCWQNTLCATEMNIYQ